MTTLTLILLEGIMLCFILLLSCVIGIANGPERFTVFYEKDVQTKAIKLGYTTKKAVHWQAIAMIVILYLPCFTLVPLMVRFLNGATNFQDIFLQNLLIMYIMGLFDRLFIDWYWVGHTKAWEIPHTEELKPYIPKKMIIIKWFGTIFGFALIALIDALIFSNLTGA